MLAVKKTVKVEQKKKLDKACGNCQITIEVMLEKELYVLHKKNVTSNNELKIMYNNISQQISITQEEILLVLILGNFNFKVGTYIQGNKPTLTKGRRKLMKRIKKYDFVIIKKEKEACRRLWIRLQGQER